MNLLMIEQATFTRKCLRTQVTRPQICNLQLWTHPLSFWLLLLLRKAWMDSLKVCHFPCHRRLVGYLMLQDELEILRQRIGYWLQFILKTSPKFWRVEWRDLTSHHIFCKVWCTAFQWYITLWDQNWTVWPGQAIFSKKLPTKWLFRANWTGSSDFRAALDPSHQTKVNGAEMRIFFENLLLSKFARGRHNL